MITGMCFNLVQIILLNDQVVLDLCEIVSEHYEILHFGCEGVNSLRLHWAFRSSKNI